MRVFKGVKSFSPLINGSVVTIGNFDGVHLGHKKLIKKTKQMSQEKDLACIVVTYQPHPLQVLFPHRPFQRLCSQEELYKKLEGLGVDYLIEEPFSQKLSEMDPLEYFENFIEKPLKLKALVVGHDFSFGKGKKGDYEFLKQLARQKGFDLERVEPLKVNHQVVSSSRTRDYLLRGDVKGAALLLGDPYVITGKVIQGDQRGRTIGFPTANLEVDQWILLPPGVYKTQLMLLKTRQVFDSVTNVGRHPTFEVAEKTKVESHIIDFHQEIYNEKVSLTFIDFIRKEQKFNTVEELKSQIEHDILKATTTNE